MWYSFKGAYPIDGTNEDIATLISRGYVEVPDKPDFNTATQIVEWDPVTMNGLDDTVTDADDAAN